MYFHYMPMEDDDNPRAGLNGPQGHGWQDLYKKKNTINCYPQNMISLGIVVLKKIF